MDWTVSPSNLYIKCLTLNVTIFEIGYLRRELKLNDVIRVGPYPIGIKPILFLVRRGKDSRSLHLPLIHSISLSPSISIFLSLSSLLSPFLCVFAEERSWEAIARKWPPTTEGEKLPEKPIFLAPWSWTFSLQKFGEINFCYLSHPF